MLRPADGLTIVTSIRMDLVQRSSSFSPACNPGGITKSILYSPFPLPVPVVKGEESSTAMGIWHSRSVLRTTRTILLWRKVEAPVLVQTREWARLKRSLHGNNAPAPQSLPVLQSARS
ncbi:unnamed protein product [Ectocarpus sp. CCAP 1310/34]|nr:unnamed protein product [Ectocarpus sp. CCAP 1310/34]